MIVHRAISIGRYVQLSSDNVSKAAKSESGYKRTMMSDNEEAIFNEALCARVKRLRNSRGWTSQEMALALGIPAERYRKYESRSPLPAYLMERFCLITHTDFSFLLTGRDQSKRQRPKN